MTYVYREVEVDITDAVEEEIEHRVRDGKLVVPDGQAVIASDWGAHLDVLVQDFLNGYISRADLERDARLLRPRVYA